MINKFLSLAIEAGLKAGEAIMDIYDAKIQVEYKEDNSPLTQADKKANNIINSFLIDTGIPIISEENKQTDYQIRKSWQKCWIVDPVDGTKEFIKRNGEFTVNIALIEEEKPKIGVIYVPATKTIYYTYVEEAVSYKAILSSHNTSVDEVVAKAVKLNPKSLSSSTINIVASRSHMNKETLDYVEDVKKMGKDIKIVSKGSSLKFCLVAEGKAHVYPRFAPTMEWDTAAGHAICSAVGVNITSKETNQELLYNKENLLNPWFIVEK